MDKEGKAEAAEPNTPVTEKAVESSTGGSKRKRSPAKSEKAEKVETPGKRLRNPVKLFQSPAEADKALTKIVKVVTPVKEDVQILYKKGSFLALRGDDGSFFLCRINQNVCAGKSRQFKLNWLTADEKIPNTYKLDYVDKADIDSILTNIEMNRVGKDTFELPAEEKDRIDQVLNKTLKFVAGDLVEEDLEEEEEKQKLNSKSEDETSIDEPPAKKIKGSASPGPGSSKKPTPKADSQAPKAKQSIAAQKKREKEQEKKRKLKEKGRKSSGKGPDRNLRPNQKIKVLEKDPFFEVKSDTPFVSVGIKSKQVFAAVETGNIEYLKELIACDNVYKLDMTRSPGVSETPLEFALRKESMDMVELLVNDILSVKDNKRLQKGPPVTLMQATSTGQYNPVYLGIGAIRALNVSRGSRDGNNAFAKDTLSLDEGSEFYIARAIEMGIKPAALDVLITHLSRATAVKDENNRDQIMEQCFKNIHLAIENGHRQTAAKLVSEAVKVGGYGYNFLHEEVLSFDNENLRDRISAASVRKKPFDNKGITPLHCAAINPNVKYLSQLLSVEPDINQTDRSHRRLIHYAAVCTSTKPLEYLLSKGASITDVDLQGNLPLHRASVTGRAHNAALLLKHAEERAKKEDDAAAIGKWGVGGIDRGNRNSYCPIHLAVMNGHMEVLKVLIKNKVNVNKPLSASKNKLTPLMMAAERGYLDMARFLVQNGATVELLDKMKRSALTHAVINGNANVASYLLYLGADPNRRDSSGNSLVHYAAAYGWYHCLKLLTKDAGAKYNIDNDWKTTPLAIAFLKGHTGIVDYLLGLEDADINFRDDKGLTLVSIAASSRLQPGLEKQIAYLVKEKKADPTIPDIEGFTALHHLCANNIKLKGNQWSPSVCEEAMDTSVKVAHILLDAGCDLSQTTNVGKTPVSLALEQVNSKLVQLLVQQGGEVPTEKNEEEKNALHIMAEQCCTTSMTELVYILAGQSDASSSGDHKCGASGEEKMEVDGAGDAIQPHEARHSLRNALKNMAAETDFLGFTPLLRACQVYRTYQVPRSPAVNQVEREQKNGRDFIKALIEVAGSDINAAVKEKNIPGAKIPTFTNQGKYTATHMMVSCRTEMPVKVGDVEVQHPGLALILQYSPNLELENLEGHAPLVMAAKEKDEEKIKILIEKGANPNVTFNHGTEEQKRFITPCLWLAMCKELQLVRMFIQFGANPRVVDPANKNNLMHLLAYERSSETEVIELMKQLLQHGLGVNDKTSDNSTVLHIAISNNLGDTNDSIALEEFLLSKGADVFAKTTRNVMPIHCVFDRCAKDPIELLSLLTSAMNDKRIDEPDVDGNTPLHLAAAKGATICCMHLLQRRADVNRKNAAGNTPLSLAVKNVQESCAIMLLQQGANIEDEVVVCNPAVVKTEEARSPEKKAASEKKEKPVLKWRPLLQQQNKETPNKQVSHSIFQGAIDSELQGVAHLLLDKMGRGFLAVEAALNVNKFNVALRLLKRVSDNKNLASVNKDNQTLFHILAIKTKPGAHEELQLQVAQMLLQKGVPVDLKDNEGCTAVQYCAIYHQPVQLARLLIENSKNIDPLAKDKMDRDLVAALMWDYEWVSSATGKAMAWIDLLLEKGLSLDTLFDRPVPDVLLFGSRLDTPCPLYFSTKAQEKISPLIMAIRNYNFGLARYLLKKGANPNFRDSMGMTPLMHAVKMNDMTMVRLLMDYDYIHDKEEQVARIVGKIAEKPVLVKKFSRNIFLIQPDRRAEEMEKDPSVEEDAGIDDNIEDNVEEGIEEQLEEALTEDTEDIDDGVLGDVTMNGDLGDDDEVEEDDADEEKDDSDHDTDVLEEEEELEPSPLDLPLPRLGSKQKSLVKKISCHDGSLPHVVKTSNINLDLVDAQGMTAFHHAVFSLDFGSFDNADMVRLLMAANANCHVKDIKGELAKDCALMCGAAQIAQALTALSGKVELPSYADFTVADGLLGDGSKPDYISDSDSFLLEMDKDETGESINAQPKIDSNCEMRVTGELYHDDTKNVTYDVTLTKVDVSAGEWGMYNFYKLQIVRQKAKDNYVLFTRWGRIGDRGQWQHTPFPTAEDAVKEFYKIFRQKTGNDWNYRDKFVVQKKKYSLMPTFAGPRKSKEISFVLESPISSKLNPSVLDLLQELTNINMLQAAAKSKGLDEEILPFGRISRCNLEKAKEILLDLEKVIAAVDQFEKNKTSASVDEYQANCEKIATLTNEFYHMVPVGGFEYDAIRPIRSKKVLKEHFHLVADLMDMEVASKILLGTQQKLADVNPMDYIYRSIGCKIQPLTENEIETQYILTYINASGHGCKVNAVYKVARPGDAEAVKELKLHNHRLLWHGSSVANVVSILSRGLLVSPADAPSNGNMFGEGVYFADCFTKSRSYCYNAVGSCKVVLLCEVALGNSLEDFSHDEEDHHDEDVHSLKILGKMAPDPDFDVVLPYGVTIPLGQLKAMKYEGKTPYVQYNEYIVHNPQQICIRYIVMYDG